MPKLLIIFLFFNLSGCFQTQSVEQITGKTMGTSYTIKIQGEIDQRLIDQRLEKINQVFSNWNQDSELSLLNRQAINHPQELSDEMAFVLTHALALHEQTKGFFSPTMGALIDIWGFGVNPVENHPEQLMIEQALAKSAIQQLTLSGSQFEKKADIQLNLSAIAKGYAVDEIAKLLKNQNIEHFMVEIGGEIKTQGGWSVGIETPIGQTPIAVNLVNESIATSGNYRQYFVWQGKRYAHILSPHTGLPVDSDLFSASVIHTSSMLADAYATAMMAMGHDKAVKMAQRLNLKAVLILNQCDNPCLSKNIIKIGL